jgi:hypothetical protein
MGLSDEDAGDRTFIKSLLESGRQEFDKSDKTRQNTTVWRKIPRFSVVEASKKTKYGRDGRSRKRP